MLRDKYLSSKEYINLILESYQQEQIDSKLLEEANEKRTNGLVQEGYDNIYSKKDAREQRQHKLRQFSENVKTTLLSECLSKLYNEVMEFNVIHSQNKSISRNLINRFIQENGVDKLLNSFKTRNILLSEYNRIVTKYHNQIMEATDGEDSDSFSIDSTIKDNFFDDLNVVKPDDVILNIRTRVSDAVQDFIDSNTADKLDIKDIIQSAEEKIQQSKIDDVKESYNIIAKKRITAINSKPKSVFSAMVHNMAESVMKNENLKKQFTEDGKVNINKVVENCEIMYTLLEMVNTTEMIRVNESYIKELINSFKA